MTMLLEDIGTYLQTNSVGTLGTNLFLNTMPEEPDILVVVNEYLSTEPFATMRQGAPLVERPRLQLVVRDMPQEVVAAHNRARAAYLLLCQLIDTFMGGKTITLEPMDTPVLTGRDPKERVLYTVNFQVTWQ